MLSGRSSVSLLLLLLLLSFKPFYSFGDPKNDDGRVRRELKQMESCRNLHFVLVHGYSAGGWTWYKLTALMRACGYKVTAIDLKGAGMNPANSSKIHHFEDYNKPLIDFLANLTDDEQVILVGHNAGGLSVTDASHRFSKKIRAAVYVAATMLKHGFITKQDVKDGAPAFAWGAWGAGNDSSQLPATTLMPETESQGVTRHNSCKKADEYDVIRKLFSKRPAVPLRAMVSARFKGNDGESVRRVYIKALYGELLVPKQQDAMVRRWPPADSFVLNSDHNLLSTHSSELFGLLVRVAASVNCNLTKA